MPRIRLALLTLGVLAFLPASAQAQQQFRRVTVYEQAGVQLGFRSHASVDGFKAGLWMPVLVKFVDDEEGKVRLPIAVDGSVSGEVIVETGDNDGAFTFYSRKFTFARNEPLQVLTYTKPAASHTPIQISVKTPKQRQQAASRYSQGLDISQQLYLALGDNLLDLHESLGKQAGNKELEGVRGPDFPRHLAYETEAQRLPDQWFGYNGVDLAIMVTSSDKFVDSLIGDRQSSVQLQALAEWVRRGGRLVVSIAPTIRDKVHRLLTSPAWQPALPTVLPLDSKTFSLGEADELRNWSSLQGKVILFQQNKDGMPIPRVGVRLLESPLVSVGCKGGEGKETGPLIVRFPHGLGSITLMAFDVKDLFLNDWKDAFWQAMVTKLAPPAGAGQRFGGGNFDNSSDLTSRLYDELEKHDTPTIAFGWVVLFIFIYILVVGPMDYFILKFVFKRMELTWLTFPAVVITVSLLAYFTAYAIKGQDLKINKIDLVDIDLRSALDENLQTTSAKAYGTTWFSILSPRMQNYTIGIEPALHHWQASASKPVQPIEPVMSWFGRPEFGRYGGRGGRSPSLFNRSYSYEDKAVGLRDVSIPVWSTKSFTASWEVSLDKGKLPVDAKITFDGKRQSGMLSGTIQNNMLFDLSEVGLVYRGQFFAIADMPKGATLTLKPEMLPKELTAWASLAPLDISPKVFFHSSAVLRNTMFHEKIDPGFNTFRNLAHRPLDWSWRFDSKWTSNPESGDARVKEAILVARVGRAEGQLEQLHFSNDPKLATHLWLGELPGSGNRPKMDGTLIQETYIRVIIPVVPRK